MLCPICKIELEKAIFYGVEVDYCPRCLGVWFEEDELRLAKDEKDKNLNWLDVDIWKDASKFKINKGIRMCPSCRVPLYEVYYGDSGIIIDVCNLCKGVWLDRGEFKKIIEYLRKKADEEILHHYLKTLAQEFWEIFTGPETLKEEISDFITVIKFLHYKFLKQQPQIGKIISSLPK